jgi:dTDP-4-dehydrorhamnose reductase
MRVLVTGGSGTLGRRLCACTLLSDDVVEAPGRARMDVADRGAVERFFSDFRPDLVVHAAAVIRSRGGNDPSMWEETTRVNVWGTAVIAAACRSHGARLAYVSTDFVFDGRKPGGMYVEDDLPAPLGYYPLSKLAGEAPSLAVPRGLVVRTSFNDDDAPWPYPKAFVDRFTSKVPASVAAREIVRAAKSDLTGILHVGGPRRSYLEFARTLSPGVDPMTMDEAPTRDPLPVDTSLDSGRWTRYKAARGIPA